MSSTPNQPRMLTDLETRVVPKLLSSSTAAATEYLAHLLSAADDPVDALARMRRRKAHLQQVVANNPQWQGKVLRWG